MNYRVSSLLDSVQICIETLSMGGKSCISGYKKRFEKATHKALQTKSRILLSKKS